MLMHCQSFTLLILSAIVAFNDAVVLRGVASQQEGGRPDINCAQPERTHNLPPANAVAMLGEKYAAQVGMPLWLKDAHKHLKSSFLETAEEEVELEEEDSEDVAEFEDFAQDDDAAEVREINESSFDETARPSGMTVAQYRRLQSIQKPVWVFASYHKTGTVLIKKLIRTFNGGKRSAQHYVDRAFCEGDAQVFSTKTWSNSYSFPKAAVVRALPNYRFIHFVRDPIDMIVSAYRYHLEGPERWLFDMSVKNADERQSKEELKLLKKMTSEFHLSRSQKEALGHFHKAAQKGLSVLNYYQAAPQKEAVVVEAFRSWPEIHLLMSNFNATKHDPNALTVRLESVNTDFKKTMRCMFRFLGQSRSFNMHQALSMVEQHVDVSNNPHAKHVHVGKFNNNKLNKIIEEIPPIKAARKALRSPAKCEC